MGDAHTTPTSLCKQCKFRFRRVFIPCTQEKFEDEQGNEVDINDQSILIMNLCLASDMDLDMDSTIECSHFQSKDADAAISFFKHR